MKRQGLLVLIWAATHAAACGAGAPGENSGTGGATTAIDAGTDSGTMDVLPEVASEIGSDVLASTELVHGLAIADVAIYQAVKVSLLKDGRPAATTDTPLVRNRQALVRVFVTPDSGWQPRSVVARLQWGTGAPRTVAALIGGPSTDAGLDSSLNFSLPAEALTAQVTWSVSLFEAVGSAGSGVTTGARAPADGTAATLPTTDPGPALKITLVPVRNKNTLPDTSEAQIKYLTDAMFALYPVAKIAITVRAPIDLAATVAATGAGWDVALDQICQTRLQDKPALDVYYHGLITPGPFAEFCPAGCIQGIAVTSSNPRQTDRCSISLGYTNNGAIPFAQEVAHAMGRQHAPCGGPARPDPTFPYANGGIGVWGYDLVRQRLIDPGLRSDFMSYCTPAWTSDYTFSHLLAWMQAVNQLVATPAP